MTQHGSVFLNLDEHDLAQKLHFKIFDRDDTKQAFFSIDFAEPFRAPPLVMTGISGLRTSSLAPGTDGQSGELSFTVSAASVNATGFDLLLEVGRFNSLYSVTVNWIAMEA